MLRAERGGMARVSEKAVRPRQYVFNGVSKERRAALTMGVATLRAMEREGEWRAQQRARDRARDEAGWQAEKAVTGGQIASLEAELADLASEKRRLFEALKRSLEARKAGRKAGAPGAGAVAKNGKESKEGKGGISSGKEEVAVEKKNGQEKEKESDSNKDKEKDVTAVVKSFSELRRDLAGKKIR